MPHLSRILIYPVKSMEPTEVDETRVLRSGALEHDRTIGFFDDAGKFINGKRAPAIHQLRAQFDPQLRTLRLSVPSANRCAAFHVDREREPLQEWLSEHFRISVFVKENAAGGWPDDTDAPAPTLISTATLREVCGWFSTVSIDQARLRFRANLEIDGVGPFWEDRLFGPAGKVFRFRIGDVVFDGINPCQRCAVPPRDPSTGALYPDFVKIFRTCREQTLPPWAERSRFNHFYRLAINLRMAPEQSGKMLRVGDPIELMGLCDG